MKRFLPRFLSTASAAAAAATILTSSAPAKAGGDGEALLYIALIAVFDVISLPGDAIMAASNTPLPKGWAEMEAIGGGLQAVGGGIGLTYCAFDDKCKRSAGLPFLIGFTAWTSVMTTHGIYSMANRHRMIEARADKPSPFSIVPMIGDGRTTPAGVGFVGRF
jgi:hypothetical protein